MMKRKMFSSLLLPAFFVLSGCEDVLVVGSVWPRDFTNCILKGVAEASSDHAVSLVHSACREKFPEPLGDRGRAGDLAYEELSKITGFAGLSAGNRYAGNIYNGNSDITLTTVTIRLTGTLEDSLISREYAAEVDIPPLSIGSFGVNILSGESGVEYSWSISAARGFRNRNMIIPR